MKPAYQIGSTVYLKTDLSQIPRIITGIRFIAGGSILYDLMADTEPTCHHEIELSNERDVMLATSNFNDKN